MRTHKCVNLYLLDYTSLT